MRVKPFKKTLGDCVCTVAHGEPPPPATTHVIVARGEPPPPRVPGPSPARLGNTWNCQAAASSVLVDTPDDSDVSVLPKHIRDIMNADPTRQIQSRPHKISESGPGGALPIIADQSPTVVTDTRVAQGGELPLAHQRHRDNLLNHL